MYKNARAKFLISGFAESAASKRHRAAIQQLIEKLGLPTVSNEVEIVARERKSRAKLLAAGVSVGRIDRLPPLVFRYDDPIIAYRAWCGIKNSLNEERVGQSSSEKSATGLRSDVVSTGNSVRKVNRSATLRSSSLGRDTVSTAFSTAFAVAKEKRRK